MEARVDVNIQWEDRNYGHTQRLSLEEFGRKEERDGTMC